MFANTGPFGRPAGAVEVAQAAEAAGFDSLWAVDHVVVPAGYRSKYPYAQSGRMPGPEDAPIPDPLVWLSYVAAVTSTIRLATGIMVLPQRSPLVIAKEAATLDVLSEGRLILGVGAGWLEEEFDALGVPFASRGKRMDDYITAMRAAWSETTASHHGNFVSFDSVIVRPQPVNGAVPIVIGGHSKAAARRAGTLGDGFFPGATADLAPLIEIMRRTAAEMGRDSDSIEITAAGALTEDGVRRLERLGVARVIVPIPTYKGGEVALALQRFAHDVMSCFP